VSADQTRRPAGDDPAPWVIDRFDGEHGWPSNFGAGECELDGVTYRSREHAFQAGKSEDPTYRAKVRAAATPGAAKGLGRRAVLRPHWDATVRFTISGAGSPVSFHQNHTATTTRRHRGCPAHRRHRLQPPTLRKEWDRRAPFQGRGERLELTVGPY